MGWCRNGILAVVVSAMGMAVPLASTGDDPGAWEYTMERKLLRDRIRLLIDGEMALEGQLRFVGNRREARLDGRFRERDVLVRCTRNPLVDALDCWVRVDGELRSNHVIVQ